MDTEFFVEKTTGQVIDQYRTVTGAWDEEEQREREQRMKNMRQEDEKSHARHVLILAASCLQQAQKDTSVWQPHVFPAMQKVGIGQHISPWLIQPTAYGHCSSTAGEVTQKLYLQL